MKEHKEKLEDGHILIRTTESCMRFTSWEKVEIEEDLTLSEAIYQEFREEQLRVDTVKRFLRRMYILGVLID